MIGMTDIIKAANLRRTYRMGEVSVYALRGVDVRIKKGEFVAIMGPSGSGKSTLVQNLGLIDTPTSGSIIIDGLHAETLTDAQRTRFRASRLGFVFQFYSLLPELNAIENVSILGRLNHMPAHEADAKAQEILKTLGIGDRMHHYPSQLSGGEQQRVSIARALMNDPKIIFADEPTANLDTASGQQVVRTFRNINKEHGQTVVMVTHERNLGRLADRIIELRDGLIVKDEKVY